MASSMLRASQAKTDVPLVCNICPKNPTFSDLSHLLTHIGSKTHLSTYYKIKVRSASDVIARQSIDDYDLWYAQHDIEGLMSERMYQKEERKRSKIKTEPRSSRKAVKAEPQSPVGASVSIPLSESSSLYPNPYVALAPMYNLASYPIPYTSYQDTAFGQEEEDRDVSSDALLFPPDIKANNQPPQAEESDDESSKLKGVFWPGMGLFDAATPELKKMRNQKKDDSVSQRLAAMSEEVEKTEQIFSPSGTLRKVRTISGHPESDDDLLPGEEMPPRPKKAKRVPRRKAPVVKDANASKKPAALTKGRKRKQEASAADYEALDDELPYKTARDKRKKSKVYHDDEADHKVDVEEATFEQAVPMTQLTAGYQQPPMYVPATAMGFRPAEATYMPAQSYYQFPPGHNIPLSYDPYSSATWEFFGYGMSPSITNPFFSGIENGSFGDEDEDNEGTISAPISESDK